MPKRAGYQQVLEEQDKFLRQRRQLALKRGREGFFRRRSGLRARAMAFAEYLLSQGERGD